MITENLSTLKIHKLTQAQYERELANGTVDGSALYLTPEEEIDLSPYAKKDEVSSTYETKASADSKLTEAKTYTDTIAEGKANSNHNHSASNITSGTLSSDRLPTISITNGGTGATTVKEALKNLGAYGTTNVTEAGTNLNDYKNAGSYYFASAYAPTNIPSGSNGWLFVIPCGTNTVKQMWFRAGTLDSNDFYTYVRSCLNGSWGNWSRFITSSDTADAIGAAAADHTHNNYASTVTTTGSGNAITNITQSGNTITATKDATYLTKHPTVTMNTNTTDSTSPAFGESFTVIDSVTKDSNGHVTKVNTKTVALPTETELSSGGISLSTSTLESGGTFEAISKIKVDGHAITPTTTTYTLPTSTDKNVEQKPITSNDDFPILLRGQYDGASGDIVAGTSETTGGIYFGTGITVNPNTNTLTASKFVGDLTGNATTATKVGTTTVGSATQPVYIKSGVPTKCTYTLGKSVPSDAVFTDTTYTLSSFGITATATELNKMDGVTATTTELNYVDGVTSNIQTQLDSKAASDHTHDGYMSSTDPVGTGSLSMNRKANTTVGAYSVSIGYECESSDENSYAEGYRTTASGWTTHAEGYETEASGNYSHAEGYITTASGDYSHAEGYMTTALKSQHIQGHHNNTSSATAGGVSGTTGSAFIIGNGTSSTTSNAFRVSYAGAVIGKAAYSSSGADYAEYFEWADGNLNNEERIGYFVTFEDGRFIRKANEGEYILGIVSGNPAVLGNHDECWMGQNEMDEWGRFIYVTETEVDEETGEVHEYETYKVNPDYDKNIQYIPRSERPEWDSVGMLGVLAVRDDGTCQVNGYCKVADGGIATASDTGYRVIERVTENIVKIVFR